MVLEKYGIYAPKKKENIDLNPLAIFSLVRKVPSAQTGLTIQRASDNATLDIDYLAGMPENRVYNLLQGSDGKQGLTGIVGVESTVTLNQGIFTITGSGLTPYVDMQWRPLIFNSAGKRIFFRFKSRLISGNIPSHLYIHIDTLTAGRTTYELPVDPENIGEWREFYGVIKMGTTHMLDGDTGGSLPDNRIINRVITEVMYDSVTDATGCVWELDGRVTSTLQNATVVIDMGTSSISPLYDKTAQEINELIPNYIKAFGYNSGEIDAASIVSHCTDNTTGYVKNWKDQTGNNYTAIQNVVGNMPTICTNDTSFSDIAFYGTDDYFVANGAILTGQSEFTITAKLMAGLGGDFSSDSIQRFLFTQGTQVSLSIIADENLLNFTVNGQTISCMVHLFDDVSITAQKSDTEMKLFVNGELVTSSASTPFTVTDTSNTQIGNNSTTYFYGLLFEICFYGSNPPTIISKSLSQSSNINDSSNLNSVGIALDKVGGAIIACALVKLNPDATKCMRVKRLSDGAEKDIGFIGKWFDLKTLENFAEYDTVYVMRWYDQSVNGFDLVPNDSGILPIIVNNGQLKTGVIMSAGSYIWTANKNCRCRYIRDWIKRGNTYNNSCHWIQIAAIKGFTNVAAGKTVTSNRTPYNSVPLSRITNGDVLKETFVDISNPDAYVTVDLGSINDLDNIVVWHYRSDARTYHGNVVQISEDGTTWQTIYDSDIDGERAESEDGNVIFERKLHILNDFCVYTGFTTNNSASAPYARIVGKGCPEHDGVGFLRKGWSINRYDGGSTGDFRIDSENIFNSIARIPSVWDTGHSLFYMWDNTNNKLKVYKDWKWVTGVTAVNSASASGGYVTYPLNTDTINTMIPLVVGGSNDSLIGSIKAVILFDHVLSDNEISLLKDCAL